MISVVNSVDIDGSEKYLVVYIAIIIIFLFEHAKNGVFQLQEFGSKYEPEALRSSKKTDLADVIVYVYDSSDTNSFSYISNLRVRMLDSCSSCLR